MKIKLFFLGCLVVFSTSLWAIDAGEFRGETKAKIEILQKQNDEIKTKIDEIEKNSQSVDTFKNTIDRQDKRIEDVNAKMGNAAEKTSWLAVFLSIWAIIITILSIIIPIFYIPKWKNEAIEKAIMSANESIEITLTSANKTIQSLQDEFESYVKKSKQQLQAISETHDIYLKVKDKLDDIKKMNIYEKVETDPKDLESALKYAIEKAETQDNASSWFEVAMFEGKLKDYENALKHWNKVMNLPKDDTMTMDSMFNRAVILGRLGKYDEAIEEYHKLVKLDTEDLSFYSNLFELQLLAGKEFEDDIVKQFQEIVRNLDDKDTELEFIMINTIKNSLLSDQTENIKKLKLIYSDSSINDWSWEELENWINTLEPASVQERVAATMEQFKNW